MENSTGNLSEQGNNSSSAKNLQTFFIYHLNRIYTAKLHMKGVLEELLTGIAFLDLAIAVRATLNLVGSQRTKLEEIYAILGVSPLSTLPNTLIKLIEDELFIIKQHPKETSTFDLSVLAFLQNVEILELASFKMLHIGATALNNIFVSDLLEQCTTEAEAGYKLLLTLMAKHLKK